MRPRGVPLGLLAGREEVERVARVGAAAGVRPASILRSGKTRAQQTAEIVAELVKPAPPNKEGPAAL